MSRLLLCLLLCAAAGSCSAHSDTVMQSFVSSDADHDSFATERPVPYLPTKVMAMDISDQQQVTDTATMEDLGADPWITGTWSVDVTDTQSLNTETVETEAAGTTSDDNPTIAPTTTNTAPFSGARQEDNASTESLSSYQDEERLVETTEARVGKDEKRLSTTSSIRVVRSVASLAAHVKPTPTIQQHHFLATANSDVAPGVTTSESMVATPVASPSRKSDRKSKPDVQDIIDGIVKLLGGKVHVQAATEPLLSKEQSHPGNTRINNRGPPRITELPFEAIPLETLPGTPSRRPPPFGIPYSVLGRPVQHNSNTAQPPFQNGIPLPEQVVPPFPGGRPRPRPHLSPLRPRPTPPQPLLIPLRPPFHHIGSENMDPADVNHALSNPEQPPKENSKMKVQPAATDSQSALNPFTQQPHRENATTEVTTSEVLAESQQTMPSSLLTSTYTSSPLVLPTTTIPKPSTTVTEAPLISTVIDPVPAIPLSGSIYAHEESSSLPLLEPSVVEVTVTSEVFTTVTVTSTPVLEFGTSHVTENTGSVTPPIYKPAIDVGHHIPPSQPELKTYMRPSRPFMRPGIVIDDTAYRPADVIVGEVVHGGDVPGEIFDITVTANQNFGGHREPTGKPYVIPVDIEDILTTAAGTEQFVSIDGKRTYFNLFPSGAGGTEATRVVGAGINFAPPKAPVLAQPAHTPPSRPPPPPPLHPPSPRPPPTRRPFRRPSLPPVRIDTCIVGDASTCDEDGHEVCRTEQGVSACVCRPGFARRRHRGPCSRAVSLVISLKVDRINEQRVTWDERYRDAGSEKYQELEWEAGHALDSAMGMTPLASLYMGSRVNAFYTIGGRVMVNATMLLQQTQQTKAPTVKRNIQRHLLQVIQRRNNNIGESALWVEGPLNPIPGLQDLNECTMSELNDCDVHSACTNTFGSFRCTCAPGYRDRHSGDEERSGRRCETCSQDYCTGRGQCSIEDGQRVCHCHGNFYGAQCEVDGEVLGVAVGASVTAVVIIVLTLICLCMWSRRWKREQQKSELLSGRTGVSPATYNYVSKGQGSTYHVTLEDRLRWAQIMDAVSAPTAPSQNLYAIPCPAGNDVVGTSGHQLVPMQPDPMGASATRPSSALLLTGTPLFRMPCTPAPFGEPNEDKDDDDGIRALKGGRSKSRGSLANQNGIYYDLEYEDTAETLGRGAYAHQMPIPLSTYMPAMGRPFYG